MDEDDLQAVKVGNTTVYALLMVNDVTLYVTEPNYSERKNMLGDKNISILHLSCITIFTRPASTCTCPLKAYAIKNIRE